MMLWADEAVLNARMSSAQENAALLSCGTWPEDGPLECPGHDPGKKARITEHLDALHKSCTTIPRTDLA
jgi:hypothetical protein